MQNLCSHCERSEAMTKASEESDRIPNGCKETEMFLRRDIFHSHKNSMNRKSPNFIKVNTLVCNIKYNGFVVSGFSARFKD